MLTLYQNNLSKGIKSGHFIISPTVNLCRNVRWIFWFYSVFFGYRFSSSFHSTGRWKTNFFGTHRLWLLTFWPFFSCLLFTKLCRGGDLQFFYWDGSPADISTWFATNFTHGRVQQLYCMTSSSVSFHFFPILRGTSWITGVQKRRWSRRSSWSLVQVMVTPSPSLTHISSIVNLFALALTGAFLHVELQDG